MSMHPELTRAIITACLDQVPQRLRRQLASKDNAKRINAEDAIAAIIVVTFAKGGDEPSSTGVTRLRGALNKTG